MAEIIEQRFISIAGCCDDIIFLSASTVLQTLRKNGFTAFFVGGAVRDLILGKKPADWDIVTTAQPEEVKRIFPDSELVGAGFGVTLVKTSTGGVEVATARKERFYMDGRHPEKVEYTSDISCDVLRRDFTVNALLLDPESGTVYDYTGGLRDIDCGIIRAIGDARTRFREDYLRMFRCIRFAARLGFSVEQDTFAAIRDLAHLAKDTAAERIRAELETMLTGAAPGRAVRLLESSGLLQEILPEAAGLRNVEQPPDYHPEGDVLEHTLLMLDHLVVPSAVLAWAVFFHDLGKSETFSRTEAGRIHFFGHENAGCVIAERVMVRLRFAKSDMRDIQYLIENHMRFGTVRAEAKLRLCEGHPLFAEALELNRLDALSSHRFFEQFVLYIDRRIEAGGKTELPQPFVGGDDLINAGFLPGKAFKTVLAKTYEKQLEGKFEDKESALAFAVTMINTQIR